MLSDVECWVILNVEWCRVLSGVESCCVLFDVDCWMMFLVMLSVGWCWVLSNVEHWAVLNVEWCWMLSDKHTCLEHNMGFKK